jgi:hypothetical protein
MLAFDVQISVMGVFRQLDGELPNWQMAQDATEI